ncbi:MAG: hypothetical protein LBR81_05965 [Prevotellaceae bacterium]|jgi:hypothetical protein|nr:hypothetical protein [Prevotellaceae bacterium]
MRLKNFIGNKNCAKVNKIILQTRNTEILLYVKIIFPFYPFKAWRARHCKEERRSNPEKKHKEIAPCLAMTSTPQSG